VSAGAVDDRESSVPERRDVVGEQALAVRTSVMERGRHRPD
jgi:hypothetical protein